MVIGFDFELLAISSNSQHYAKTSLGRNFRASVRIFSLVERGKKQSQSESRIVCKPPKIGSKDVEYVFAGVCILGKKKASSRRF